MSRADSKSFSFSTLFRFFCFLSLSPSTCLTMQRELQSGLEPNPEPWHTTRKCRSGVPGRRLCSSFQGLMCYFLCLGHIPTQCHPTLVPFPFMKYLKLSHPERWTTCTYLPKALWPLSHCFTWQIPPGPSTARLSNEYAYLAPSLMIILHPCWECKRWPLIELNFRNTHLCAKRCHSFRKIKLYN